MPELSGMADNFRNFWQALAHLRDLYAPNVVLGQDLSIWGADYDLTIALRNDPNYDWQGHADRTATYHNSFGPGYGLNFFSPLDRDAAYYQAQYSLTGGGTIATQEPSFNTIAAWLGRIDAATNKRSLMWQVPNGNQQYRSENNTDGHYQDNRAEYFLNPSTGRPHMQLWANYGVIGLMFGAGAGGQSHYFDANGDGITNPAPIDGNNLTATLPDDDGGYIRLSVTSYYLTGPVPPCRVASRCPRSRLSRGHLDAYFQSDLYPSSGCYLNSHSAAGYFDANAAPGDRYSGTSYTHCRPLRNAVQRRARDRLLL